MKNSTEQSNPKSSGKEGRNAKNFRIPISNGIFEHYQRLKDSRWLLDLYVDWTTKEVRIPDGSFDGVVLGGKPIRDEDTAVPFGCCARTTRRWRQRLARFGYIDQLRTPLGYVIRVKKSKKWPERPDKIVRSDWTKLSHRSEGELQDVSDQKYQVCPIRTTDHVRSNKTLQGQDRDKTVEEGAAATAVVAHLELKTERNPVAWEKAGIEPCGSPKFNVAWEQAWRNRVADEPISVAMERCDQRCQAEHIPVPARFYERKKELYRQENPVFTKAQQREARNKEVLDRVFGKSNEDFDEEFNEESDEVSRIAGPRGVREELMR